MISIIKLRMLRLKDDILVFVLMTVMALGFTAIFGASFNSYRPTVLIVDNDNSSYSEILMNELKENNNYNFINSDMDEAVKEVEDGNVLIALIINEGFKESVESGGSISIGMMKLRDDTMILTLQEIVSGITLKMAGGIRIADITADFIKLQSPNINKEDIKVFAYDNVMESWKYKTPINVSSKVYKTNVNSGYDSLKHAMIGFNIFFSMYTMVFGIGTILDDRKYKTWQRMLISPVSKVSVLGGTIIVTYLLGALQIGVLILGGKYLFDIDLGNSVAGIITISAAFVFAVTSLGLMLSGIVKTNAQLGSIAPIVLTSTSMLGGCMWPLEIVNNKVLLFLAELTPQKWAVQGIGNIASKGMGFQAAIFPTIVLLIMGIIFFGIGLKIMKFE
ncbi:MAG: ABC transporter permease [Tissierellia bacterium]|nr:ABC transporter permease [Tissierellia bacterium]MDD4781441.1 ABC transporter permease [Tissierellia bacterium]